MIDEKLSRISDMLDSVTGVSKLTKDLLKTPISEKLIRKGAIRVKKPKTNNNFLICIECNKEIQENAMKCPISRRLVCSKCLKTHVHKCGSFHKKFTYWGRKAYQKYLDE